MSAMQDEFDAVVIGGGTAGLSAALALGRATRRVLVVACEPPRNALAHGAHNVFTRDGTPPHELLRIGREQLRPYDVIVRDGCATDIAADVDGFVITVGEDRVHARGVVLATGVRDVMPEIPGFRELWGTGVFHCPYCHGWEVAHQPLAIYGRGEGALHFTILLRAWSRDIVLFTDGPSGLSADDENRIRANGIIIRDERVERLIGTDALEAVVLANGEVIPRAGLFLRPTQELRSDLPLRLGCTVNATGRVQADAMGTNVPFVFVAGDIAPGNQSVASAAASGAIAGAGLNHELLVHDFNAVALNAGEPAAAP
jgi:thioredoxin reductase